ncbi:probable BOI-related E3 ubiquitin-protein ligase 3 [Benincasa hispida]|uniref:probable BOI-related E3 ubiquitin-protein ligase 3 n=1 Tax=Benincasa hispida TaxID=102211 RepID=UPI0019027779|nr:probable BOI-related E3 ubiquitin-protein ligase 3 [Benincasa hispida]
MAVEARHLNLFHPQLIGGNRELVNLIEGDTNMYNSTGMGYGGVPLVSGTTTAETLLPAYNSVIVDSSVSPPKTAAVSAAMKSDSGLTYNYTLPLPRKRARECMNMNPFASYPSAPVSKSCGSFSFLGEDISLQIHQQQLDIDRLISQHLEKVRSEVEERRKRQARRIIEAIEVSVMKRLKLKEEEIEKMGKLNWALEERVKSLCIENQLWRDMAQTNEAAVNALRNNLEQVLCQVNEDRTHVVGGGIEDQATAALVDDAQSSCGSNEKEEEKEEEEGWRVVKEKTVKRKNGGGEGTGSRKSRMCRNCGKEESSVLLLPCRHLCLCTVCGSSVHTCPICKSTKNASVHVNMS